jgi:hypothetical protein
MKDKLIHLVKRFGMLIPFVITVILLLVSGSMVGDNNEILSAHYQGVRTAMWVFFSIFVVWLGTWLVRVGIHAVKTWKLMDKITNLNK